VSWPALRPGFAGCVVAPGEGAASAGAVSGLTGLGSDIVPPGALLSAGVSRRVPRGAVGPERLRPDGA
jgi:hypothetical protein